METACELETCAIEDGSTESLTMTLMNGSAMTFGKPVLR
jgi:hypothetical protein